MAGAVQEINGEWKIVKLRHDNNAPKDLAIPAKFTYKGKNEVSVEITGEEQTVEDTGWITELGTPIHLKDIAAKFTDVPVNDGGVWKIYRGVSAFTEQSDIIYPTGITIDNLLWNKNIPATGGTATESNCTYKVNLHYNNDTTKDITDKAQVSGQESVPATQKPRAREAGTLQLTATYGKFTSEASVKIWQNGVGVVVTSITLDNLTWTRDIPAAGGTATTSNCSYTVTAHYNDRSTGDVTNDATVTGSKEVDASTLPERHDAGTLTLRAEYEGKIATASTTIYQAAASKYLRATCRVKNPPSTPSTTTLEVESNISWTASSNVNWITLVDPTGTGNKNITVNYSENTTQGTRPGKITVNGAGVDSVIIDIIQKAPQSASLTIEYTGATLSSDAGTTNKFKITAQNVDVTGYSVNNEASIIESSTTTVKISYPANTEQTQKTYTVTVKGKNHSTQAAMSDSCDVEQSASQKLRPNIGFTRWAYGSVIPSEILLDEHGSQKNITVYAVDDRLDSEWFINNNPEIPEYMHINPMEGTGSTATTVTISADELPQGETSREVRKDVKKVYQKTGRNSFTVEKLIITQKKEI